MEDHQQHDLVENLLLSLLTRSDHTLVSLRFSNTAQWWTVHLLWLKDLRNWRNELRKIPGVLLHGVVKALTTTLNQKTAKALNRIAPIHFFLAHRFWDCPWFLEELQMLKRAKRWQEHHWRKNKNKSNQTWVRASVKAYLVAIRSAKHHCFSTLIVSSE